MGYNKKVNSDLLFSLFSLVLLSVCGLTVNVLIGTLYSPEILGLWGQMFAIYIIVSQFGSFGIQFSVQALTSSEREHSNRISIINSSYLLVFPIAIFISLLLVFFSEFISNLFESSKLYQNLIYAAFAVLFYSFNKVIIGSFNGLRQIKQMSILQAGRGLFLLIGLILFYLNGFEAEKIGLILIFTEVIVFILGCLFVIKSKIFQPFSVKLSLLKKHLNFGLKSMFSGVLIELNTKVDTVLIGYFLTDKSVGLYTLSVSVAEGFFLLLSVFRNNFNPIIAENLARESYNELKVFVAQWKRKLYLLNILLFIVSIPCYFILTKIMGEEEWSNTILYFTILSVGPILVSGYFPFLGALLQKSMPGWFSFTSLLSIILNLVFNIILIRPYGLMGAAVATSLAVVISTLYSRYLTNKLLKFKLL